MRFASIGTRAASRLFRKGARKSAGFTLLEALVALALVLAFAAALGPYLFHARRIMAGADGRIAAQVLLRSLLRGALRPINSRGRLARGRNCRLALADNDGANPYWSGSTSAAAENVAEERQNESAPERANWTTFSGDRERLLGSRTVHQR